MFFLNQKFAMDEQATAGSAVGFASAASREEVASAAAMVRSPGEFEEEDASPATRVRGCETGKAEANQSAEPTAIYCPFSNPFPRLAAAHF